MVIPALSICLIPHTCPFCQRKKEMASVSLLLYKYCKVYLVANCKLHPGSCRQWDLRNIVLRLLCNTEKSQEGSGLHLGLLKKKKRSTVYLFGYSAIIHFLHIFKLTNNNGKNIMPPPNLMQVFLIQRKACPPFPLEGDSQTLISHYAISE